MDLIVCWLKFQHIELIKTIEKKNIVTKETMKAFVGKFPENLKHFL